MHNQLIKIKLPNDTYEGRRSRYLCRQELGYVNEVKYIYSNVQFITGKRIMLNTPLAIQNEAQNTSDKRMILNIPLTGE